MGKTWPTSMRIWIGTVLFAMLVAGSMSSEVSSLSEHSSELELLQEGTSSVNDATTATAAAIESVSLADDAKTAEEASKQDQEEAKGYAEAAAKAEGEIGNHLGNIKTLADTIKTNLAEVKQMVQKQKALVVNPALENGGS